MKKPTVLITGGAKGLGQQIAVRLAGQGYPVAISYLDSEAAAQSFVARVQASGGEAAAFPADLARREQLAQLVARTEDKFGPIGVLINNAGPFVRERRRFADYTNDEVERLVTSNLTSVMELDLAVLPGMRQAGFGRIVHFGFAHAAESRGWPHRAVYAAAKVGLVSFTKTLAVEEAEFGITVNMICPGDIKGDNKEKTIAEMDGRIDPESPRLRPGSGEDVARVAQWLLEPASDFVTGAIIDVAGGMDPIRNWPLVDDANRL